MEISPDAASVHAKVKLSPDLRPTFLSDDDRVLTYWLNAGGGGGGGRSRGVFVAP